MVQELPDSHPWLYDQFVNHGLQSVRRSDRPWAGIWTDLAIEQLLMRSVKSRGGLTRGRGFTESVRMTWVHTMHRCASVHHTMTSTTGLQHRTSDQHVEMRKSRVKRDMEDQEKMIKWFQCHNPFATGHTSLCSLSSGLVASDDSAITCDEAERIGAEIQSQMLGCSFSEIKLRKKDTVRSLQNLERGVIVDKSTVHLPCSNLFNRLIVLTERKPDMASYFAYELTPVPASLFKDDLTRKPVKSALGQLITKDAHVDKPAQLHTKYVLDGGALLHHVRWMKNATWSQIIQQYVNYVERHYGLCVSVVFDGYSCDLTTKDHEHMRRSVKTAATVVMLWIQLRIMINKHFLQMHRTKHHSYTCCHRNCNVLVTLSHKHQVMPTH